MVQTIEAHAQSATDALGRDHIDPRVLAVMDQVPRHEFVSGWYEDQAYEDRPLPIGHGQTISQPFIVALMTDLLRSARTHVVLEVGTGSGYQAAVLAASGARTCTRSRSCRTLAESADERLARLGYDNVAPTPATAITAVPEAAPFDGIVVTAAASRSRRR